MTHGNSPGATSLGARPMTTTEVLAAGSGVLHVQEEASFIDINYPKDRLENLGDNVPPDIAHALEAIFSTSRNSIVGQSLNASSNNKDGSANEKEEPRSPTRSLVDFKQATLLQQPLNGSYSPEITVYRRHESKPQLRHHHYRGNSNSGEEGDLVGDITVIENKLLTDIQPDMIFKLPCPGSIRVENRRSRTGRFNLPCPPGVVRVGVVGVRNLLSLGPGSQISPECWTVPAKEGSIQPAIPVLLSRPKYKRPFKRGATAKVTPYDSGDRDGCRHPCQRPHASDGRARETFGDFPGQVVDNVCPSYSPRRRRIRGRTCAEAGRCTATGVTSNKRVTRTQGRDETPLPEDPEETRNGPQGPSGGSFGSVALHTGLGIQDPSKLSDSWPVPLDDEPPPESWKLGGEDCEVLAAAERIGSILVRVVTWNLHAKPAPGPEELRRTLLPLEKFHIVAFGTEECLNSIAKSMILHSKREWESRLKETLGGSYEMLCGHALQATHNAVFAHRGILPLLRNVRSFAVATGIGLGTRGATLGNKGGVGIAFDVGATTCIFVNAHLAAHQNNVAERNEHFCQIQHGLVRALAPEASRRVDASALGPAPRLATPTGALQGQVSSDERGCSDGDPSCSSAEHGTEIASSEGDRASDGSVSPASTDGIGSLIPPSTHEETTATRPRGHAPPSPSRERRSTQDPTTVGSNLSRMVSIPGSRPHETAGPYPSSQRNDHRQAVVDQGDGPDRTRTLPQVFDRIIWAGDLNYRVNVSRKVADQLLAMSMHEVLVNNEQLTLERARGGAFSPFAGYREGPLNFRPTYKFDSGTDVYDSSSKKRVPSWTDRVLYGGGECEGPGTVAGLDLRAYRSVAELKASDHRPVLATFIMGFERRQGGQQETAVTNQTSSEVCSLM